MYNFGTCPRCKMQVESERLQSHVIICNHCGFSANLKQRSIEKAAIKNYQILIGSFCTLLTFAFMAIVHWDTYVLEAMSLKAKQLTSIASSQDLNRLVEICEARKNISCQIDALNDLSKKDIEALPRLGKIQYLRGNNSSALSTLSQYFNAGGLSLDASYDFARALEKDGQVEMASRYYQSILDSKPDTLQITVTKNYIKMLMDYNKKSEARIVLSKIRQKGENTKEFMDPVFKELERTVQ